MQIYSNELYHFGVKGMKWGHSKVHDYIQNKVKTNKEEKPKRKKTTAVNITRSILSSVGTQVIKNKTGIDTKKAKVLGMIGGEVGSYAVGKALKLSNKDLIIESAANVTKTGVSKISEKVLSKNTNLIGAQRIPINIASGTIASEGTRKILKKVMR